MTKSYSLEQLFQQVWAFHAAFNYDNRTEFSDDVTTKQLESRLAFLREELDELLESTKNVDVVDAVVDELYFAVGTMCQAGLCPSYADLTDSIAKNLNLALNELNVAIMLRDADDIKHNLCIIGMLTTGYMTMIGVDATKQWDAVHGANMSKLDRDGKPIYNDMGKIQKPVGWQPPDNATPLLQDGIMPDGDSLVIR